MEIQATADVRIDPSLRPTRCGQCGYRLIGLPEEGRCPECGFEYSPRRVVVFGWASGSKLNAGNMRASDLWWHAGFSLVFVIFLVLPRNWGGFPPRMVAPFMVGWLLMWAWAWYRRRRNTAEVPRPTQARLFAEGCAQRDGVGDLKLVPWGRGRLKVRLGSPRPGRYRLRIWSTWLGLEVSCPVDVELECDVETAERLRTHIEWCRAEWERTGGDTGVTPCPD